MKRVVILLLACLMLSFTAYGQHKPTVYKSPKPSNFTDVLQGVSSWNFIDYPEELPFSGAWLFEEIRKWIGAIRPGIHYGILYSKPSTEHLYVNVEFETKPQISHAGWYWWYIWNIKIHFIVGGLGYEYVYSLPDCKVASGNFDDHSVYDILLYRVCGYKYQYNGRKALHLANYSSGYDEARIRIELASVGCFPFEGIYEDVTRNKYDRTENSYKLAVKYIDGKPCIIYLDGANLYDDWKEGEFKAWLEPTASSNVFRADWLMSLKTFSSATVSFDGASMRVYCDGSSDTYVKLFPSASDKVQSVGSEWTGTGFALKNGYVVTNHHVVEGAKSIFVKGVNGNMSLSYKAAVVGTDPQNDLAIIKITDSRFTGFGTIPYAIKSQAIDVGERIWVLGYPLSQALGNDVKLTDGIVNAKSGYQGDISTYQISAPVQPGNSGSPMFDSKGNVVGIVNAGVPGAENVGYAVKTLYLNSLASKCSVSGCLPTYNYVASLSLKEQVKQVESFVFLLYCSSSSSSFSKGTAVGGNAAGSLNTVSAIDVSIKVGEQVKLSPIASNSSTFSVPPSDGHIVKVTSDGIVTGCGSGVATIWEEGSNGKFIRRKVTVHASSSSTTANGFTAGVSASSKSSVSGGDAVSKNVQSGSCKRSTGADGSISLVYANSGPQNEDGALRITQIRIQDYQTIIDFEVTNTEDSDGHFYQWIQIVKDAYIVVDGKDYAMTKVSGISVAPGRTDIKHYETLKFKLFFPPISRYARKLDFVESPESSWKIYNVPLY